MKKELLIESFVVAGGCFKEVKKPVVESRTILIEGKSENLRVLRIIQGPMGVVGEKTGNGRLYSVPTMETAIQSVKSLMDGRALLGQLDHPEKEPKLKDVSHIITNLWFESSNDGKRLLCGEWEIVDTWAGQQLNSLYEAKAGIGTSYRGYGVVKEDGEVTEYDFKGVDAVFDPSAGTFISEKNVIEGRIHEVLESKGTQIQEEMKAELKKITEALEQFKEEVSRLKANDSHINAKVSKVMEVVVAPGDLMGIRATAKSEEDEKVEKPKIDPMPATPSPEISKTAQGKLNAEPEGKDSLMGKTEKAKESKDEQEKVSSSEELKGSLSKAVKMIESLKKFIMRDFNVGSTVLVKGKLSEQGDESSLVVNKETGTPQLFRIARIADDKVTLTAVGGEIEMPRSDFEKKMAVGTIVKVPELPEKAIEIPSVSIDAGEKPEEEEKKGKEKEGEESKEGKEYVANLEKALSEVRSYSLDLEKVVAGIRDYSWKCEEYAGNLEKVLKELREYALSEERLSEDLASKLKKSFAVIEGLRDYALNMEKVSEGVIGGKSSSIKENQSQITEYVSKSISAFPILEQFKDELLSCKNVEESEVRVRKYLSLFEKLGHKYSYSSSLFESKKNNKKSVHSGGESLMNSPGLEGYE